jgi:serine/threonine-protein kinase
VTSLAGGISAVTVADVLLYTVTAGGMLSVALDPEESHHVITTDDGSGSETRARVPSDLALAVVTRLALIAGLPATVAESQLGRVRVRLSFQRSQSRTFDLMLAVRCVPGSVAAEIHRIAVPVLAGPPADETKLELGKYEIYDVIGSGGMGVVYRARHVLLDKPVAIKVLRTRHEMDGSGIGSVGVAVSGLFEARAACRARHPGIVDVTDCGTLSDGGTYLVMELVDAPTLDRVLQDGGALAPTRFLKLAVGIAEALGAAGNQGVVHRDLTPTNIFICEGDRPKITDFGIARLLLDNTDSQPELGIVGTPAYMSPEQARGERVDARSDIYSLGCVMYHMITGNPPFTAESIFTLLLQQVQDSPPPIVSPHGPVPEALKSIVYRAMAKRPEDRFQTAGELAAALTAFPHAGDAAQAAGSP